MKLFTTTPFHVGYPVAVSNLKLASGLKGERMFPTVTYEFLLIVGRAFLASHVT